MLKKITKDEEKHYRMLEGSPHLEDIKSQIYAQNKRLKIHKAETSTLTEKEANPQVS